MAGTYAALHGLATRAGDGTLNVLTVNYLNRGAPDSVTNYIFANAPEGIYRLNVYRIDGESSAAMKAAPMANLPPAESRLVYVHADFHFDVYTPADSVTLAQLVKAE
jgi:hypothetical protein